MPGMAAAPSDIEMAAPGGGGWVSDARQAMRDAPIDYFAVQPWRYWADFLISLVVAFTSSTVYLTARRSAHGSSSCAFPLAVFWLYRLGSLIHEVCHLGHHEMRAFKVAWNLLVGVLTLAPSPFFTRHHRDHHSARMYGTPEDPEYVANVLEAGNWKSGLLYALHIAVFPILVFLRFLLAPLTFLSPRLRQTVLERASSLTMNTRYRRRITPFDRFAITAIEIPCFLRAAFIPVSISSASRLPHRIVLLYVLAVTTLIMNQMRQLADHHFEGDGRPSRSNHTCSIRAISPAMIR